MAISQQSFSAPSTQEENEIFYKVILENDLSKLDPKQKVQHVANVCKSLGLNPLTKPIQLHKFQGKEVMYMAKDGAEQIRNIHNVSIVKLETELLKGDLYVVKAYAMKPNGRQDCSTSALSIAGLKGDAIGNAMKKCETQAKRRVTLSICGLGMLDETELENLPQDKPSYVQAVVIPPKQIANDHKPIEQDILDMMLDNIKSCETVDELKDIFTKCYRDVRVRDDVKSKDEITKAKDIRKTEIENKEFLAEYDSETGEVDNETTV